MVQRALCRRFNSGSCHHLIKPLIRQGFFTFPTRQLPMIKNYFSAFDFRPSSSGQIPEAKNTPLHPAQNQMRNGDGR